MAKPNIIIVVSDQHRGDWLHFSGSELVKTPNLDSLADGGVSFTQAYCGSPLCVPSRMSMMTGRHPSRIGVYGNEDHLASNVPTFAHALSMAGYDTVLCGRMHFVGPDQRHGFQTRLVGDITPSYPGGPKTNYAHLTGTPDPDPISIQLAGPGPSPVVDYDEAVVSACEDYLLERRERPDGKPLLMTVGLYSPHAPYTCPPEQFETALAAVDANDRVIPSDEHPHPSVAEQRRLSNLDQVTQDQIRMVRANYAGLINHLDENIGRIVLAAQQLPGDTILVYVSDHGEMAGDHGLFWKRSFYEGSVRVPMIWSPIKQNVEHYVDAGVLVDVPVTLTDLAATLVSLTGSPRLPNGDGEDLSTLLCKDTENDTSLAGRPIYSELIIEDRSAARMVRRADYKLIYYHGQSTPQLFNLAADADETHDLGADSNYAEVRDELTHLALAGWDAPSILLERSVDKVDKDYMRDWGRSVGAGRMDLWEESGAFYRMVHHVGTPPRAPAKS